MRKFSKQSIGFHQKKILAKKVLSYTVNFISAEEDGYTVEVPVLPGCITEGDTFEEAEHNAREAILAYIESLQVDGEIIPREVDVFSKRITVSIKPLRI